MSVIAKAASDGIPGIVECDLFFPDDEGGDNVSWPSDAADEPYVFIRVDDPDRQLTQHLADPSREAAFTVGLYDVVCESLKDADSWLPGSRERVAAWLRHLADRLEAEGGQ